MHSLGATVLIRIFLYLVGMSLWWCYSPHTFAASDDRPHIILVMADDQGYGDVGYTGHPFVQTPNMDKMAGNSVVFQRFYAAAPVCSPTRASVMTGRHPIRGNVPNHGHYLRPHERTVAEALKDAGYVTGQFGKWHIGSVQAESPTSPGQMGFDRWLSGLNFFDRDPYLSDNGVYRQMKGQGSVVLMDAALEFLEEHHDGDKPIFSVIWFPSPHDPFDEVPTIEGAESLYKGKEKRKYFLEITLLDQQLGRLRAKLRELGIADNTLLWYCSDNGGLVEASSGGRARKGSIYEGGLRVPALLEWPARYEHKTIDVPAVTSDIYPTLLKIANAQVEHQPQLDGVDLTPIIAEEKSQRPGIGFWFGTMGGQATWNDRIIKTLMVAQQEGKPNPLPQRLLKNVNDFPEYPDGFGRGHAAWLEWPWKFHRIERKDKIKLELYNLEDDPTESNNLVDQLPDRVDQMLKTLRNWQASVLASHEGSDYLSKDAVQPGKISNNQAHHAQGGQDVEEAGEQEQAQWIDLAQGDELSHWRGYRKDDLPPSWEWRDGSIYCNGNDNTHLATRKQYGDFELTGEWKISKGGNSGILLRVVESSPWPANTGLEVQILDHPDSWKEVNGSRVGMGQAAGALYGFYPAKKEAIKSSGEWNTFRILMQGSTIKLWQNDIVLVDVDMASHEWKDRLARSKFAKSKEFNKADTGHIVLQSYRGAGVWYRNLRIREISTDEEGDR